jgi:LacI family transcriptional regulator
VARTSRSSGNVTIIDVAQEAGVSYATVSRVLNNDAHVKPDTRERVIRSITRLGYTVNQQARMLAGGRSHVVGLLVPDLGTGYIGEIMRGVDEALATAQYDLMLYTTHRRKTKESAYVASLTQGMTDGLLLVLPRDPGEIILSLRQRHFPYVLVDHQGIGDVESAVGATNRQGGYEATHYLFELGHRRIGFITGAMDLGCSRDRLEGYQAALRNGGLPIEPRLIQEGDFWQPSGFAAAQSLLALP